MGGSAPVGATGGAQVVIDHKGNVGIYIHGGGGGYMSESGGATVDISIFGGTTDKLQGLFTVYGGGGGEGLGFLVEANLTDYWLKDVSGSAVTASVGLFGGIPATAYGMREASIVVDISEIISPKIIVDYWKDVGEKTFKGIKNWFGNTTERCKK